MKAAPWRKTPDGRWTAHLGVRGQSIRIHQLIKDGTFYRDIGGGSKKSRRSLGTKDKSVALAYAKQALAELLRQGDASHIRKSEAVTLGALWRRYREENAEWLDNKPTSRRDDIRRAKLLIGFFGDTYDVMLLSKNEQSRYETARRWGFTLPNGDVVRPVKQATVWADIVLLQAMLRWGAMKYQTAAGQALLPRNPLALVKNKKETHPSRPVATKERYLRIDAALEELSNDPEEKHTQRWRQLRLFLAVINQTGRRLSAVRHLRWSDINFVSTEITWRARYDKKGREATIPFSESLTGVLRDAYEANNCPEDGWLFAAQKNSEKPVDKRVLTHWMAAAERRAQVPKLKGGVFHPFRRKFASELQNKPIKQVMALGGWADQETMQTCYVQVTNDELRTLVNN